MKTEKEIREKIEEIKDRRELIWNDIAKQDEVGSIGSQINILKWVLGEEEKK